MVEYFSETQRKGIAAMLYTLAEADNHLTPEELYYVDMVSATLDLEPHVLDDIREEPAKFPLSPPPDEQGRMQIVYFLIFLCSADGKFKDSELRVCKWMGIRLGFSPLMIDDMIRKLIEFRGRELPPKELLDIIKKYLN